MINLSVIIPARSEFPNIIHTVHNILNAWESSGFDKNELEIIVVDNCTKWDEDGTDPNKPGVRGTSTYLMPRGGYWSRLVRILYDPIAGNHSARNKGAVMARGEYLFFSDAHMSYKPEFFKHILKAVDESGGIVHAPIGWMGANPFYAHGLGYQYTIKLGEEIKGTWNNYLVTPDDWFYIPALGHCSLAVRRDQFIDFGGYPKIHRSYGGGEFYLNMKWWMFGSSVVVEPRAVGYHLASPRGYTYNHDDYIENVLGIGYALSMDWWRNRTYLNYLRKGRKEILDSIMERNRKEYGEDRRFIEKKKKYSFNEMISIKTEYDGKTYAGLWNKLNMERFGKCNGQLLIFHPTWIELLKSAPDYMKKSYKESDEEKKLSKFIVEDMWDFVYHKDKYDKNKLPGV